MLKLPFLQPPKTYNQMIDNFGGFNAGMRIPEGEWNQMQNLSSDWYPMLATRKRRGMKILNGPTSAIMGKDELVRVTNDRLYHGEDDLSIYFDALGYSLRPGEKHLVNMGAYIVIFPDKLYINTANPSDCGSLEAHYLQPAGETMSYEPCDKDGTLLQPITYTTNGVEPPDEGEQRYWLDMGKSGDTPVLKEQKTVKDTEGVEHLQWVTVPETYLRISCPGIGEDFAAGDCVSIAGAAANDPAANAVLSRINGKNYRFIVAAGRDFIAVEADLVVAYQYEEDRVSVDRETPDMDFVIECGNRLWGCKYGQVGKDHLNEIYACKLGDFKNWRCYQGISTDSYTASRGTDGPWTGAITYKGNPLFFKETSLEKVYPSETGAHRILTSTLRGVQNGCSKSLAIVNEVLYYKCIDGICAYDGSVPVSVGDKLGNTRYRDAVGGAYNGKYYVSMSDERGGWHLFAYDTKKAMWHREDSRMVVQFAACKGDIYAIDGMGVMWTAGGTEGTEEPELKWSATSGVIGYTNAENKYVSRFNIRMQMPRGSSMDVYLQYDSDGIWHHHGHIRGKGIYSFVLPIRPRRCDHFLLRVEGKGEVKVYSITKILEIGSDM